MDALSWFKSVSQQAQATPAPLRAGLAKARPAEVPLHVAAARLRPAAGPADDDEDWDTVIARAKMQAASPKTPSPRTPPLPRHAPFKAPSPPPPPPSRNEWADMPATPPPSPARQRPTQATLDRLFQRGSLHALRRGPAGR
jgi:hypothetical protein